MQEINRSTPIGAVPKPIGLVSRSVDLQDKLQGLNERLSSIRNTLFGEAEAQVNRANGNDLVERSRSALQLINKSDDLLEQALQQADSILERL